jgi:DTW domain-containing protein YfiP
VVILQHWRERFHVVGTARIARLGLASAEVHEVAGTVPMPDLPAHTALLYPAPDAVDLASLPAEARPRCLLVLDGTWHHARRLYLDNPWLRHLPAVRLSPEAPSRYRIRRQAREDHVSTIESIVAALRILEPETPGMNGLLDVFDSMIDDQQAYMLDPDSEPRFQLRRPRASRAVPTELLDHAERLVLVYGETSPMDNAVQRGRRQLVSWTALRPATGETFERLILPRGHPPNPGHLMHMGLSADDLSHGRPHSEVARDWSAFRREDDLLSAWNSGRLRMLRSLDDRPGRPLLLKALWSNLSHDKCGSLDDLVASLGLSVEPVPVRGRAGRRLGQALAMARHMVEVAPRIARLAESACQSVTSTR